MITLGKRFQNKQKERQIQKQPSPDRHDGEIHESERRTQAGNGRTKKNAANSNARTEKKKRAEKKRETAKDDTNRLRTTKKTSC